MHVVNTDTKSYWERFPERCLEEAERGKKKMYLEACLQQRRHLSPFVSSVDGLLGVEVTARAAVCRQNVGKVVASLETTIARAPAVVTR